MSSIAKCTIDLTVEHSAFIDAKVASGAYASASEEVRASLRALQERNEAVERWLREDVAPTYDATTANSAHTLSAVKVLGSIRARHAARTKKRA